MAAYNFIPCIPGTRFGRLVTLAEAERLNGRTRWLCRCDCGKTLEVAAAHLRRGITKSCGCLRNTKTAARSLTHGQTGSRFYWVWSEMKRRCTYPSHKSFHRYGGRGITVCDRWLNFANFAADMGPTYKPGLTLERDDNNAGYSPGNCRWAPAAEQTRNTRQNVWVETSRGRMLQRDIAVIVGVSDTTISNRLKRGVIGEALFAPPGRWLNHVKKST